MILSIESKRIAALLTASVLATACSGAVDPVGRDAGTPGTNNARVDAGPSVFSGLVINEVAAAGDPADWFELYNGTSQTLDLASFTFTDDAATPTKGTFATGTMLAPGAYIVQEVSDETVGFKLGGDEALYLFDPTGAIVDEVDWDEGASPAGGSYGRIPNATGPFKTLATPTPGAENVDRAPTCGDDSVEGGEVCDGAELSGATCESVGLGAGTLGCNASCDGYDTTGCGPVTSPLVINELTSSGDSQIELYFSGTDTIELEGYWIADSGYDPADPTTADNRYDFPAGTTIAVGGYLVLVKGVDHAFGLGGSGDALTLHDPGDAVVDTVTYAAGEAETSYCRIPNGTGPFQACSVATFGEANRDDGPMCGDDVAAEGEVCDGADLKGQDCTTQGFAGGTLACNTDCDGFDTSGCEAAASAVVINEASSTGDDEVELYNAGTTAVDVSGWYFGDDGYDPADPTTEDHRYVIGSGVTIGAGQYLVFVKGVEHTFGLGGDDAVTLYDASGAVVDVADWPQDGADPSYCRIPDGTGAFLTCGAKSFGAQNVPPSGQTCGNDLREGTEVCDGLDLDAETCVGQGFAGGALDCNATCDGFVTVGCYTATATTVVVNEAASSGDDEIELFNTWTSTVDVSGWYVTDDGYDPTDPTTNDHRYDLPAGTTIGPRGFLVLVKGVDHGFGLGGEDGVFLYDATGLLKSAVVWPDGEASTSYCRRPDGVGAWSACPSATFGATNGTVTTAALLLNEVYYDGPSSDAPHVFTEIWGPAGFDLTGYSLVGINGNDGAVYQTVPLSGAIVPADGLLVVATSGAMGDTLAARDFVGDVDWQNGPDAVQLLDPMGAVVDALQYGDAGANNAGEGAPAADVSNQSLSRDAAHSDSDDNATDFTGGAPTPGL
jgi:hypothetical protein